METLIAPLERRDLNEQVYRALRESILRRHFKSGEKISIEEIADKFKVSRSPVMAALQRLANEGLVEIIPQRGTFVTELTARDVTELFDIRLLIELHAAEHVLTTGKTAQFLEGIKQPMARMKEAMVNDDYGDYETFIANDRDLHLTLVKCLGNQRLTRIYSDLNVHLQIARAHYMNTVEKARQAYMEHEQIVKAFRSGKADKVRQALRRHIETVKERILEILDQHGGKL